MEFKDDECHISGKKDPNCGLCMDQNGTCAHGFHVMGQALIKTFKEYRHPRKGAVHVRPDGSAFWVPVGEFGYEGKAPSHESLLYMGYKEMD